MKKIYFKPHAKRNLEKEFFEYLTSGEEFKHISENYKLSSFYLDHLVDTGELKTAISNNSRIKDLKKRALISGLDSLPNKVRVAKTMKDVSVDFVIEEHGSLTFVEFHEKQHYRLSDKRLKPIFSINHERFEVPRFLQRLIKDVWRWQNLPNFKIVWHNWFDLNKTSKLDFELNSSQEFGLSDKLTIKSLARKNG
jgi:hypothetical protein